MAVVESQAGRKYCASFEQMCDRSKSARESATLCSAHTAHRKLQAQHSQSTLLKSFHLNSLCPNYQSSHRQSRRARAWPWDSFAAAGAEGERGTDAYLPQNRRISRSLFPKLSRAEKSYPTHRHRLPSPTLQAPIPVNAHLQISAKSTNVWSTDGSHRDFHRVRTYF